MAIHYFAYGSNMLLERIKERVPSARVLSQATLKGYVLRFNKLSKDGSGKANIVSSNDPGAVVHGVLYHLDEAERPRLDRAEGLGHGYERLHVRVIRDGTEVEEKAFTYIAAPGAIRDHLRPFRWYKDMVIAGAIQNDLPGSYIRQIETVDAIDSGG